MRLPGLSQSAAAALLAERVADLAPDGRERVIEGATGKPLALIALTTHVQMAAANDVTLPECVAAIRHLAPYVGYPTAAVALQQLQQLRQNGTSTERQPVAGAPQNLPDDVLGHLAELDSDFTRFFADQFDRRWVDDDELSPRERALCCLAADVLNQTLDESFALHVDLATAAGAGREQIRAVLLLVAEYGIAKAWRAYRALAELWRSPAESRPRRRH